MIRIASKKDIKDIANLAVLMWKDNTVDDLADEFSEILSCDNARIFLKYDNDLPVGFVLTHGRIAKRKQSRTHI